MTPYERVKAAWDTPDRENGLDHAVETMAAEGLTQKAIEGGLKTLLLEVRAAGADDDTEEIINGVWDRLTGWCHEDWHIHARTDVPADSPASANGHAVPADTPAPTDAR